MTKVVLFMLVVALWFVFTLLLAWGVQYVLAFFGVHVPLTVIVVGIVVIRTLMPSRSS